MTELISPIFSILKFHISLSVKIYGISQIEFNNCVVDVTSISFNTVTCNSPGFTVMILLKLFGKSEVVNFTGHVHSEWD